MFFCQIRDVYSMLTPIAIADLGYSCEQRLMLSMIMLCKELLC